MDEDEAGTISLHFLETSTTSPFPTIECNVSEDDDDVTAVDTDVDADADGDDT